MDYIKLTQVFRNLALQAGDKIMEIYSKGNVAIETKGDFSPVTNADKAADSIIYQGLEEAFPDVALVTEENLESQNQFLKLVKDITSKGFVRSDYKRKLVDLSDIRINLKGKK